MTSGSHRIQLSHQSHWAHTDCIGMLPLKDMPSRPDYVTVSRNFTETEKVKQNKKTEEFVPNERKRKKKKNLKKKTTNEIIFTR